MRYTRRQIIGIVLWWAEGTKARRDKRWENTWMYHVDFTNTDSQMIKLFLEFLREDIIIEESRLKLQLQIHEGDDKEELEQYWSLATKIPKDRFYKTIVRPKGNKVDKNKGTCKIRYCDKQTYKRLSILLNNIITTIGYRADR